MLKLELGIFSRHQVGDCLPPQSRRCEDVGLVDGDDGQWWVFGQSDLSCYSTDTLDFGYSVDTRVPCGATGVRLLSFAEVYVRTLVSKRRRGRQASDSQRPPISSRSTIMLTPSATLSFSGLCLSKDFEMKFDGRMLA